MLSYFDLHCDTLTAVPDTDTDIYNLPYNMLDIKRMYAAGMLCQLFAICFPPRINGWTTADDDTYFKNRRQLLYNTVDKYEDILALAFHYTDIQKNKDSGRISAILSIEDGRVVDGQLQKIQYFYDMGVRCMSLQWNYAATNYANCFGYPNTPTTQHLGLTRFGKEAVSFMQQAGMLIDVSHLSDGGFWDVWKHTKEPIIASHSNCRSICPHLRNLTDEMIRALANHGGISGVNFYPNFIMSGATYCTAEAIASHIEHFIQIGGEDCVGIGTDFDGFDGTAEICAPTEMHLLFEVLKKRGLTERQLEKVAYKNALRVFKEAVH